MTQKNSTQGINSKLATLKEIVTNYTSQKHKSFFLPPDHNRYLWHSSFAHINPVSWSNAQKIPYVAATGLVDAYSLLPNRPDLAFNSLWSASNSLYNDLYVSNHLNSGSAMSDSKSIDFSIQRISQLIHQKIPTIKHTQSYHFISIFETIKEYIRQAPDKNFNFIASYILKGIAVESHNKNNPSNTVREILIPSSYKTLKKKFPTLYSKILTSTGAKYFALCTISETACNTDIDFGVPSSKGLEARNLVHATGKIIRQEVLQFNPAPTHANCIFDNEKHWLSFLILSLLYATRNNAAHGNAATRLNSIFANGDSITSTSWTFLFGYCYFSLILLSSGKLAVTDLTPIYQNSQIPLKIRV